MSSATDIPKTESLPPEEPVPGYRKYGKLGEGAFGQVFYAAGPGDVPVALKIVDLGTSEGRTEFKALDAIKRLNCPNMVPIFGIWLKDATGRILSREELYAASDDLHGRRAMLGQLPYQAPLKLIIAMGLGDQTLRERLRQCLREGFSGIPPDELLRYMEDAARAIDFLGNPKRGHGDALGGVQHGDIKPANMLVVANGVQLCDYGLARVLSDRQRTGFAGTPAYSAPESFKTCELSSAADQYSLAVSYVELRTGALPLPSKSTLEQVMRIHCDGALDLSRLEPAERAVIKRATSVEPADRFPTTEEMVKALRAVIEPRTAAGRKRSYPFLAALAVAPLSIAFVAAGIVHRVNSRPDFEVTLAQQRLSLHAGDSTSLAVHIDRTNFSAPIEFEWPDLPPGVEADPFQQKPDDGNLKQIALVAKTTAQNAAGPIHLRATSGGIVREAAIELTILPVDAWLPPGRGKDFQDDRTGGYRQLQDQGRWYAKRLDCKKDGLDVRFVLVVPTSNQNERPFYISENKVTNELFGRFAAANADAVKDSRWKEGGRVGNQSMGEADSPRNAHLPVLNVTWEEARRCAEWLGGRLPTSRQWDLAAGFSARRDGPFQGKWDPQNPECPRIAIGRDKTGPLDATAETDDVSDVGCRHMSGNGYEWTRTNAEGTDLPASWGNYQIRLRGQSYREDRPFTFLEFPQDKFALEWPTEADPYIGFRIVLDDLSGDVTEQKSP
jgi:serine/threonine protein kinase